MNSRFSIAALSKTLNSLSSIKLSVSIFTVSLCLFLPFLGRTHLFDWDEINFAECAREMLVSGNYLSVQIDFQPFWEKPPLFIWMQVVSMKLFGVSEFSARLPNAICGAVTLSLLFLIGERIRNRNIGLLWAACFGCSLLPHFYFHSGIIDPWFNLFIAISLIGLYEFFIRKGKPIILFVSAIAAGLAVLTKGPVALLVIGGVSFLFACFNLKAILNRWLYLLLWAFVALLAGLSWFIWLWFAGYQSVISQFIEYQIRLLTQGEAGHGQPWFYHPVVLFFGCFPISIPALAGMIRVIKTQFFQKERSQGSEFSLLMLIFFGFVLLLFSAVTTKIVHYSSLCYFPITFFAAEWLNSEKSKSTFTNYLTLVLGLITGLAVFALPFAGMYISNNYSHIAELGIVKDAFAMENLKAEVNWTLCGALPGFALLVGAIGFVYFLKKQNPNGGYAFLFVANLIMLLTALPLIVPKIERITQGAAIDYFISKQNKRTEIITMGYKSYAQFFYAQKQEGIGLDTVYISKCNSKADILAEKPKLNVLWEKNGFVAYE